MEEGALLDVVVGDELERFMLRENGSLIVEGTVSEVEDEVRGDPVVFNYLEKIAHGKDLALLIAQGQKPVESSFKVMRGDGLCTRGGWENKKGCGENEQAAEMLSQ